MITISYGQVKNPRFQMAFGKLMQAPLGIKTSYQIKKIAEAFQSEELTVNKAFLEDVVNVFGKKDAEGKLVSIEGQPGSFDIDESQMEAFQKASEEFNKRTLTIERNKVTLTELGDLKLSGTELVLLEPLYTEGLSAVPTPKPE